MHWRTSLVILMLTASANAAYVVTQSGRQINGVKISAGEEGAVTLTTATGQKLTFRKEQYRSAAADRPKQLEQAERLLQNEQGEQAVPLLKQVKSAYRFLEWDQTAILLLANYYYHAGQFLEAVVEFEALDQLTDLELQARHRDAVLKTGNRERICSMLETDISTGSREAAARAYLMRGDLKNADGDRAGARRDWLKVATFFNAQKESAKNAAERISNTEGAEK